MQKSDTIAAIATAAGRSGIGIIRISGPDSLQIGETLSRSRLSARRVLFRQFYDTDGQVLDHGICFHCPAPQSFSGEDVVEVQAHGGPVLLDMLLERICQLGARLARAGEFTERAFINGKIDLAQAEAIADLIESGSRAAARAAMRSLQGEFSIEVNDLVADIIHLRSFVEAALDFAEEEIDFLADDSVESQLTRCRRKIDHILQRAKQGRILKEGISMVLAGLPNAGKSSLLNALAGYEAAIVTEIPGTTRDVLREHISLRGIPLHVLDTAGLHDTENPVEREGIKRAWREIEQADIVLLLVDSTVGITPADQAIIEQLSSINYRLVYSKADLLPVNTVLDVDKLYISTRSGQGIEELIDRITGHMLDYNQDDQAILARRRHIDALQQAASNLEQADAVFSEIRSGELMAEDLRQAQQHLNEITGEFTSEDLLGHIFSRFCIGK